MKRILLALLITLIFPFGVKAEVQTYDLHDTLELEGIEIKNPEYEENDDQVYIYLFRGEGCIHCKHFLEFLNELSEEEYGDMFKLRAYEVSYNQDNSNLKNRIVDFFNIDASGVPLIVIGENTFYGFSEEHEEKIKTAIKNEYESEEKYDVFEEMQKKEDAKNPNDALYILIPLVGIGIIAYIIKKSKD